MLSAGRQYSKSIELHITEKGFLRFTDLNMQELLDNYQVEKKAEKDSKTRSCEDKKTNPDGIYTATRTEIMPFAETQYLIINLKRFTESGEKITTPVIPNPTLQVKNVNFELMGIACHLGDTAELGHYIFYKHNYNDNFGDRFFETW